MRKILLRVVLPVVALAVILILLVLTGRIGPIASSAASIDVEKFVYSGSGYEDADTATGPYLTSAQNPVIFKFTIRNDGNFALTDVNLTDTDITEFYTDEGCTILASFPTTLEVDEIRAFYAELDWAAGQHTDTATAEGTPPTGNGVLDTDNANYFGQDESPLETASIDVEKFVYSGSAYEDADTATGPYLTSAQNPVTFKFTIHNDGNIALASVNLTDTDIATFYTDEGCTILASFPTALAVDETKTFYAELDWAAGQHTDTATAEGTPPAGNHVLDTDNANYIGQDESPLETASIDVEKFVYSGSAYEDADTATGPYLTSAQNPVTFRFTIRNDGNFALTDVNLTDTDITEFYTDEGCTILASFPTTLEVDEIRAFYAELDWAAGQHTDTATAEGTPPTGNGVLDTDNANYFGQDESPLEIVIYTDFLCGACERLHSEVEPELRERYVDTGKAQIEIRLLGAMDPVLSMRAAEAALCAGDQGKFLEYVDALFGAYGEEEDITVFSVEALTDLATELGLDEAAFASCLDNEAKGAELDENMTMAQADGVSTLPAVLVGNSRIEGRKSLDVYIQAIEEALAA